MSSVTRLNEDIAWLFTEYQTIKKVNLQLMNAKYKLFDSVRLTEAISLSDGGIAEAGTAGAIVEILEEGKAYLVELFGGWVKYDEQENFVPAPSQEQDAFRETIGIETVYSQQLELVQPARETVSVQAHLLSLLDELTEEKLALVRDFAEFLQQKQRSA